jgi:hypothetical protein
MRYLDNLIAWGDSLYRKFTPEDNRDAAQLYALARRILGDRPLSVSPLPGTRRDRAFDDEDWLAGGNVLIDIEQTAADGFPYRS